MDVGQLIDIAIALVIGAWAGIMFDAWTLDKHFAGDGEPVEPFRHYLSEPWWTLKRFWGILGSE